MFFWQARKALCALRALVKLQALVRGHLVRKQTTTTLRQMHALMAIQVRARFQRIQMAEESSQLVVRSKSSRHGSSSHDHGLTGVHEVSIRRTICERQRIDLIIQLMVCDLPVHVGGNRPRCLWNKKSFEEQTWAFESVTNTEKGSWTYQILLWRTLNLKARAPVWGVFLLHSTE